MPENKEDKKVFLTPVGAIIALVCFFLPWVKVSCAKTLRSASGADVGGIFWLVFVAAVAIIVTFFYFRSKKQIGRSKAIAILGSTAALVVVFIKYASLAWGHKNLLVKAGSRVIDCTIQVGAVGTIIGFILAIAGSVFVKTGGRKPKRDLSTD